MTRPHHKTGRVHYLERTGEDEPWIRARVIVERDGLSYAEIFEIGEPVHLRDGIAYEGHNADVVWWIRGFGETWGVSQVFLTTERQGTPGEYGTPVQELVKVPAMLRIALACSD